MNNHHLGEYVWILVPTAEQTNLSEMMCFHQVCGCGTFLSQDFSATFFQSNFHLRYFLVLACHTPLTQCLRCLSDLL